MLIMRNFLKWISEQTRYIMVSMIGIMYGMVNIYARNLKWNFYLSEQISFLMMRREMLWNSTSENFSWTEKSEIFVCRSKHFLMMRLQVLWNSDFEFRKLDREKFVCPKKDSQMFLFRLGNSIMSYMWLRYNQILNESSHGLWTKTECCLVGSLGLLLDDEKFICALKFYTSKPYYNLLTNIKLSISTGC